MNQGELFIHVGAPRTGTSFLRKYIFPKVENVQFSNKEEFLDPIGECIQSIAHYGDGDELSLSVPETLPDLEDGKHLISEEHLLWSVYHMFGNVGTRARLLKTIVPHAKILITIRRQPEFLISIYNYFQKLESWHLGRQLKTLKTMTNLREFILLKSFYWRFGVPCGIEYERKIELTDVNCNYFNRRMRHFIAADFSWFKLYRIYCENFGKSNVFVLPQEIWEIDPRLGVETLENFFDEKISVSAFDFSKRVNSSRFNHRLEQSEFLQRFTGKVLFLVAESNKLLDDQIEYVDLSKLKYHSVETSVSCSKIFGKKSSKKAAVPQLLARSAKELCDKFSTHGILGVLRKILAIFLRRVFSPRRLALSVYLVVVRLQDHLRGTDFEGKISLETLGLDPTKAEQYEPTKLFELGRVWKKIDLPEDCVAIDFGSGKGKVAWWLALKPEIREVIAIELSEPLFRISSANFSRLNVKNITVVNLDAVKVPFRLIDKANVFYFYNPFPRSVFTEVFKMIEESICSRRERWGVIIYFNPLYEDIILSSKAFKRISTFKNIVSNAKTSVIWVGAN